jgi:hypothetical protein
MQINLQSNSAIFVGLGQGEYVGAVTLIMIVQILDTCHLSSTRVSAPKSLKVVVNTIFLFGFK